MEERKFETTCKAALRQNAKAPETWKTQAIALAGEAEGRPASRRWKKKKLIITALILVLAVPVCAYAAFRLLSPSEAALLMGERELAQAFDRESGDIVTKEDGDYTVSLLGLVSGKQLSNVVDGGEADESKTYVAVAVQRSDGEPIEDFGDMDFYVSPLIEGLDPLVANAATFNNGYQKIIRDGIVYCISEWDDFEIFADRKLYVTVIQDEIYPSREAVRYDKETGRITENPEYDKVNVVFEVKADRSKANEEEAAEKIREIERKSEVESDEKGTERGFQEVEEEGITFKIRDGGMYSAAADEKAVCSVNFYVGGKDIKSVQLKANKGKLLQPELVSKERFERLREEMEKKESGELGRIGLNATHGLYLLRRYDEAASSIKVDYTRMTKDLWREEAIELITTRESLPGTRLEIIVTKTDGTKISKRMDCSKVKEVSKSVYRVFFELG